MCKALVCIPVLVHLDVVCVFLLHPDCWTDQGVQHKLCDPSFAAFLCNFFNLFLHPPLLFFTSSIFYVYYILNCYYKLLSSFHHCFFTSFGPDLRHAMGKRCNLYRESTLFFFFWIGRQQMWMYSLRDQNSRFLFSPWTCDGAGKFEGEGCSLRVFSREKVARKETWRNRSFLFLERKGCRDNFLSIFRSDTP
jgi:hypothetical protein